MSPTQGAAKFTVWVGMVVQVSSAGLQLQGCSRSVFPGPSMNAAVGNQSDALVWCLSQRALQTIERRWPIADSSEIASH